jgi:putative nucleotidyltransferase with HDIG domain
VSDAVRSDLTAGARPAATLSPPAWRGLVAGVGTRVWRTGGFAATSTAVMVAAFVQGAGAPLRLEAFVVAAAVAGAVHGRFAMSARLARLHVALNGVVLLILGADWSLIVSAILAAVVAGEVLATWPSRESVIPAGLLSGASGAVLLLVWLLVQRGFTGWDLTAGSVAGAAAGGLLGAPIALAVGPLAEWLFDQTTRLTMTEWLNFEHPLLRELASKAPGTFQHSVSVSVLADAAASAIRADSFLARVGALYHDVGKVKAPEYFGENQHGVNPHTGLSPWESAAILRGHVDDGVELLRYYGMSRPLARFVREHHGTALMPGLASHPAAGTRDTYRYAGPRPRSRETAIVMVADQLEALARVSPPADLTACTALVRQTTARLRDSGELDESTLTPDDLARMTPNLAAALQAMYHRRVGYAPGPVALSS